MTSGDFAALLIAVAWLSYLHAVGPVEAYHRLVALLP